MAAAAHRLAIVARREATGADADFTCRLCGGKSYSPHYPETELSGIRLPKPSHYVCDACSVQFADPAKFSRPPRRFLGR